MLEASLQCIARFLRNDKHSVIAVSLSGYAISLSGDAISLSGDAISFTGDAIS